MENIPILHRESVAVVYNYSNRSKRFHIRTYYTINIYVRIRVVSIEREKKTY